MQRMGELPFTPRGSKPMMSKRRRRASEKKPASAAWRTKSTPDAPGPPGSTTSDPIRDAGVRRRETHDREVQVAAGRDVVVAGDADLGAQEALAAIRPGGRWDLVGGGRRCRSRARAERRRSGRSSRVDRCGGGRCRGRRGAAGDQRDRHQGGEPAIRAATPMHEAGRIPEVSRARICPADQPKAPTTSRSRSLAARPMPSRTTRTEHGAWRRTLRATLPSRRRRSPV